ncbi:MAG TPA: hypothetical protein VGE79_08730 [Niastella sp.]
MTEQDKNNQQNKPGKPISRRVLLGGAATAAVVLLKSSYGQVIQKAITQAELKISDPTKVLGPPPGEVGTRSKFEKPVKKTSDTSSVRRCRICSVPSLHLICIMSAIMPGCR